MVVKLQTYLKIGQKIYVLQEGKKDKYVSSIENFNENKIYISIPYCQQVPLVLHRGEQFKIQMPTPENILQFKSTVLSMAQDNIPLIAISYPDKVERIQLRKFVRLDILMNAQYAVLPEQGNEPEFKSARALNISAGGIKLAVNELIKQGTQVIVQFNLNIKNKDVSFSQLCTVRRTTLVDYVKKPELFHIGLEFNNIGRRDSDLIVQFIFDRMRKNLTKNK